MKKVIRRIIVFFGTTSCSKNECTKLILTENELNDASEKITDHVFEFINWLSQNTEHMPYSDDYFIIGSSLKNKSLKKLYKHWLNNK